jgi:hypothetical protein
MSFDVDRLYNLLPAIYRIRDAAQGEPLKALLSVIADQVVILEENLAQLYDDQFVETCASWVLPYIGDLIGVSGLPGLQGVGPETLSPRAEVANTIGYRRRKGTAAMLEQLARDVTGWPARAVEFFQLLATTQYLNHLRPENRSFFQVRDANRLEYLGSAFEHLTNAVDLTHTVDVRRIASGRGRYNIPNIGLFLWRLNAYSLTRSPAVPASDSDKRRFLFSPLGNNAPLFNRPQTEAEVTHLAEPINVPMKISRRLLNQNLDDYYGQGQSLLIELAGANISDEPTEKTSDEIMVCDLTDWANLPTDKVAIDPVLGRIAFPEDQTQTVLVTFHYGFSANLGGGEYNRITSFDSQLEPVLKVANTHQETYTTIQAALEALGQTDGVVEVADSGRYRYAEKLAINAGNGHLEIRAADKRRPTLVLSEDLQVSGSDEGEVTLNGLLITGAGLKVGGDLSRLRLRHCTLVPGLALSTDGAPSQPATPSLVIASANTIVEIENCIVGGLRAVEDAQVRITNSIVDATDEMGVAYAHTDGEVAGGPLRLENSTVIGKVHTTVMELASNTIFLAAVADKDKAKWPVPVQAQNRQEGCVRFSYLPARSRVPRRYRCQPETDEDAARVRPLLISLRYGDAEYCQLSPHCPVEIQRGADDESEMGAFHDLYQPQREDHLHLRLEEYLKFGLEAGILYAT